MAPVTVTTKQALQVVRALLLDKPEQFVADISALPVVTVRRIGEKYGAPDKEKLEEARAELEQRLAKADAARPAPVAFRPPVSPPTVTNPYAGPRPAVPAPVAAQPSPAAAAPDGYTELLDQAEKSQRAATRAMAERIRKDLDKLSDRVEAESAESEERRRREAERAKLKADEAQLKKQLAEIQARLRGKPVPAAAETKPAAVTPEKPSTPGKKTVRRPDYDFRAVRAWAKDNGVYCPPRGMWLPDDVVEQWRAATQEGAA